MPIVYTYITHGGFELIRDVWLYISLLFASADFQGLITVVFVAVVILSAISGLLGGLFSLRYGNITSWVGGIVLALFFYAAFLMPTAGGGTIVVYDDIKNRTQNIGGIPPGLVVVAGILNKVTIGMENLIESVSPLGVTMAQIGHDSGIKMLQESRDGVMETILATAIHQQFWNTAYQYGDDCLIVEMAHSPVLTEQIKRNSDNRAVWQAAANPALYTVSSLDAAGNPITAGGAETVTCAESWRRIQLYFSTSTAWDETLKQFCDVMQYDSFNALSYGRCRNIYANAVSQWVLGGMSEDEFVKQLALSKAWYQYMVSMDSTIEQARTSSFARISGQLSGMGLAAQDWLPALKVVIATIIIGVTPVIILFMISPIGLDAFKFLMGLFIWYAIWCLVDHLMLCLWMGQANEIFQPVSSVASGGHVGMLGMDNLWPLASKCMALLGGMRFFGMLVASMISFGVLKLGGSAMAHLASGISGTFNAGGSLAGTFMEPAATGQRNIVSGYLGAVQTEQRLDAASNGWEHSMFSRNEARANTASHFGSGFGEHLKEKMAGGTGPTGVAGQAGKVEAAKHSASVSKARAMGGAHGAGATATVHGNLAAADAGALAEASRQSGLSVTEAAHGTRLAAHTEPISTINKLQSALQEKDFASAARTLGDIRGKLEATRVTAGGMGPKAKLFNEAQAQWDQASRYFVNSAVGHFLQTGTVPSAIREGLHFLSSSPEGGQLLQKSLSGITMADISAFQASRINSMLSQKGRSIRVSPGDTVTLSMGYQDTQAEAPFTISDAKAVSGVSRSVSDTATTTSGSRSTAFGSRTIEAWRGVVTVGKTNYPVSGGTLTEYSDGRIVLEQSMVTDPQTGEAYRVSMSGRGSFSPEDAQVRFKASDLAVSSFEHGEKFSSRMVMDPQTALNLSQNPEQLRTKILEAQGNALKRIAFINSFTEALSKGLATYGSADGSTKQGKSEKQEHQVVFSGGLSGQVSGGGLGGIRGSMSGGASSHLKKLRSDESSNAASRRINILAGKIRRTLENVSGRDGDAAVAAYRVSGMTQNWIKSNYAATAEYQKLEKKGAHDMEHISGDKVIIPKMGPISTIKPESATEEITGEQMDNIVREGHKN